MGEVRQLTRPENRSEGSKDRGRDLPPEEKDAPAESPPADTEMP